MQTIKGDIFKLMQPGEAMMHGCNSRGVMGSGIAATVRKLHPGAYEAYHREYTRYGLELGEVIQFVSDDGIIILNAITQEYFGGDGQRYVSYDAISLCCEEIVRQFGMVEAPPKLYSPLIGAGLAGGCWDMIKEILRDELYNKLVNTEFVIVEFDPNV